MKPLIIGIAGGTGSGKTTLVNRLLEQFGEDISVLPHDSYYAAHHELTLEERQALNYDHPASFDTHRMIQDLRDLKAGKAVQCPVYDYTIYDRTDETVTLSPNKVILVEGILIFENKELRDLLDIKIFVDTDADVRILRRLTRDVKDRGTEFGLGGGAVPVHRQAHARPVRRTLQAVRRRHRPRGGQEPGGPDDDHPAHRLSHRARGHRLRTMTKEANP